MENDITFNDFTTLELFEYLLDHLIIPPDSEFDDFKHFKSDMKMMAQDFYERNVNVEV
jgi:hypothetical protein